MSGKLMGLLGLSCMNPSYELGVGASEALHYLFKILVLHRSKWHEPGWPRGCSCGDPGSKEAVGVGCRPWVRDIRGWSSLAGGAGVNMLCLDELQTHCWGSALF